MTKRYTVLLSAVVAFGFVSGCTITTPNATENNSFAATKGQEYTRSAPRVLALGDSMMTWNTASGQSVPQQLAHALGETVQSRAVPGARMRLFRPTLIGMSIPEQFIRQKWDTVVMNGGGNDIWQSCGCRQCDDVLDGLISRDGRTGAIPSLVKYNLLPVSDHVVYSGYLRTPGRYSLADNCTDEGDELERRIQQLANKVPGFHFVSNKDVVPHGSGKFHGPDSVHPSPRGSREMAHRIARKIQSIRRGSR